MKISAVVLTKNEEKTIERCLSSLDFIEEVIIIDDFSSDQTIKKIEEFRKRSKMKVKIFQRRLNNDFAQQRNFGLNKARGDWVFFIDADEEVSDNLKFEIRNLKFDNDAYYIKRRDFFWGREIKYGEIKKVRNKGIIRLVKKNSGKWEGKVHENFKIQGYAQFRPGLGFKAKTLKNFLNHYPHQTLKEFLEEINFYSSIRAKELFEQGRKTNIFEIIFYPLGKFILNYFFYFGFLDGPAGFIYAFFMSFHSFLVRAKLFQYYFEEND